MNTSHHDERGFTVMEVMIATALSMLAATSILGILVSQNRTEKRATDFTVNQEDVRQALVYMQRDLRSAEPLVGVNNVSDFAWQVDLNVYDNITATTPVRVSWRIDPTTSELRRDVLDSNGNPTTTYRLRNTANRQLGQPLFSYYNERNPLPFDLALGGSTSDIAYCTVRVGIDLRAAPNGSTAPVRLVSDVMLRNKLPGTNLC